MHPSSSHASFSLSSKSSGSASSLKFGKTFFKSIFLNINEDVELQLPSQSQSQLPSTTPSVLPIETKSLMDVFLDQQRGPSSPLTTRPITTRLPPELRFLILRYATYPPFPWSATTTSSELLDSNDRHLYSHPNTTSTIPFHIRLSNYTSEIKWKASLTRVCKEWNLWGQEFLWEDVWVASGRDGRVLVDIICEGRGQGRRTGQGYVTSTPPLVSKEKEKFSLKSLRLLRPSTTRSGSAPISDGRTPPRRHPQTRPSRRKNVANYIKKLHIETPSMDRCCAFDLMSILERCERLEVFIDLRSVRRAFGFVGVGVGVNRGLDWSRNTKEKEKASGLVISPGQSNTYLDPILQALTTRKTTLKHLTFTNYKYDSDDFEGGIWFWEDVVGRALNRSGQGIGSTLESLEVVMSTRGVGMGSGRPGLDGRNLPSARFDASLLTSLDIPCASTHTLLLPSLHSLRIPLTSPTLLAISTWSLPSLQSLCVVSIDFTGWRRVGFKKFMDVHGSGLIRFEIVGGGESVEEEGWITEREDPFYTVGHLPNSHQRHQHLHLPSTSPKLKHFICSTNASEWNWETPDWIAPHVLMPDHFGVERIGVWGLEGKVVRGGDWEEGWIVGAGASASAAGTDGSARGRRRRTISTWTTSRWDRHSDDFSSTQGQDEEDAQSLEEQPFFMLQEQFGSLLRKEAFPSLVSIRDMSWESDLIRRSVGIGCGSSLTSMDPNTNTDNKTAVEQQAPKTKCALATFKETVASRFASFATPESGSSSSPLHPISSPSSMTSVPVTLRGQSQSQSQKILKFWLGVLEMCDRRGVYLEDWMGRRVVA